VPGLSLTFILDRPAVCGQRSQGFLPGSEWAMPVLHDQSIEATRMAVQRDPRPADE